ncbi:MAG: hypothetical protein N3A69_03410, partial [Leptospiraceae bacterium]|nr:hypothetical protein [Leptospiraceae bacterium]
TIGASAIKSIELMATQSINNGLFPRVTFLDFYLSLKNWKLIFFTLIHLILLERMYSFFREYFQSLGKTNAERTKAQRTRR